jgi:threonine dehydrogenase-like Zn-dependent dehydrogenase
MLAPVYGLCEKAENVPFPEAALCEPLGVALGTLKKARAKAGQTLLVIGAGSIGLCMLAAAKVMGLEKIVVCARGKGGLKIAEEMGAYATVATKAFLPFNAFNHPNAMPANSLGFNPNLFATLFLYKASVAQRIARSKS